MEDCRPAQPGDVAQVATLARAMRAELAPLKGGRVLLDREARGEPLEDAYHALLNADDAYLVVGSLDSVVVGFGAVEVEQLRSGANLGIITDLFVDLEARSVGVGELIAKALVSFCTDRGCIGVDARALPGHRATKNFFEEQGFTARALVMHHVLQPDP
jgi:GNAT superfamily N-acetyltransferase